MTSNSRRQPNIDIGIHGEYSIFIDQYYYYNEREHIYTLCMFKNAKQISNSGGNAVIIGYWDSWTGQGNNKYLKMKYLNGNKCWGGPARSFSYISMWN
ncbi:unnamed protein product [Rotaria magnacalcarata]|uniref:Protein OS9-like domain-containing protein n=1 Tax=Rotaria magnacalcarata TaxID=392030 RepID=A0A816VXJ9_9BILA|nr:unnamed protein product [Rotaria magnacalcarata]